MNYKFIKVFFVFFTLFIFTSTFADELNKEKTSPIFIESMNVTQTDKQYFKTYFKLKMNADRIADWQLGFFSFHFFNSPNSQIKMQICEENNNLYCTYLKTESNEKPTNINDFKKSDLSAGYLTVLAPVNPFPLNPNKTYEILFSDIAGGVPNISLMPQGFFIYNKENKNVFNILVNKYINHSFDTLKTDFDLKSRLKWNWYKSIPYHAEDNPIVPLPVYLKKYPDNGSFYIKDIKRIYYNSNKDFQNAKFFRQALIQDLSLSDIHIAQGNKEVGINFISCLSYKKCSKIQNKEGYLIDLYINKNNAPVINIYSKSPAGGFYALQTLRQLWNSNPMIMTQTIIDYPRFSYRGFSLDVARHFFQVDEVKKLLDVMGAHKLNTLHLHLSDDEGWRIEVKDFPELTNIGSKRYWGHNIGPTYLFDGKTDISNYLNVPYASADTDYKGYYTKKDILELISYANERQITIIPEIEMPGHARAMLKASPNKFADPNDRSVYFGIQGYTDNVLPICQYLSNNNFKKNINLLIQNISDLFKDQKTLYANSQEISLSGDEVTPNALTNYLPCHSSPWNLFATASEKSHYFFQQISKNISPEIKISGWQQIVQNDDGSIPNYAVPNHKIGHTWAWIPTKNQGIEMASQLIQKKYPTVIAFADYSYFDIAYTTQWNEPGLSWATTFSDTYKVLSLRNKIDEINKNENILGLEGALWTEIVPTLDHLMYMTLPKMAGLSEAAWSPLPKNDVKINWQNLAHRLGDGRKGFLNYLNQIYKVKYRGYPNGIKLEVPLNSLQ